MCKQQGGVMYRMARWYFSRAALPYWCICILDFVIIFMSMILMYCLVYGPAALVGNGSLMLYTFLVDMAFYCLGMRVFHTYASVFRMLEPKDLMRVVLMMLFGTVMCMAFRWAVDLFPFTAQVPYRVFVLTFVGATVLLCVWRVIARMLADIVRENGREEVELLPRQEIEVNMEMIGRQLCGQKVLITGAAGSIGSELVRQIAVYKPAQMIMIDQAETPMHSLMLEVEREWGDIDTLFIVATITNRGRMEKIFTRCKPDYVFHAAAYKHVPMMEDNPSVSVQNNVIGTRVLADLSVKNGVKKFVMISTDKAVNPTNVMGCSKRICEIYVQSLNDHLQSQSADGVARTQFVTTRFGNVLGSNGSVIPLFKKQIEAGGPVTVTHPDIIRFFMLIPEACKLVLEAGTLGHGGEVFVFDMGEPVKIVDLARKMIHQSGRRNIEIVYTGLRDGEKLYEEVLFKGEEEQPTVHPKIRIANVRHYEYDEVCRQLDELDDICKTYNEIDIVRKMKMIVPEFKSNNAKYEAIDKELEKLNNK
ncbi:MAG: polysaccharide biosynthesis protein [Prevotellaceae bacterium]|nr:polysaccharide biosynthesis protein [Prevotellaceae bacterium]